jgi:hypothetical protein
MENSENIDNMLKKFVGGSGEDDIVYVKEKICNVGR